MHELSIAQSVIQIIEKSLPANFDQKVIRVHLQIGELSGIEIEALEYSFNILKDSSLLPNAKLAIENIDGSATCNDCSHTFHISKFGQVCPLCQSNNLSIIKGKEMKVSRIEAAS